MRKRRRARGWGGWSRVRVAWDVVGIGGREGE